MTTTKKLLRASSMLVLLIVLRTKANEISEKSGAQDLCKSIEKCHQCIRMKSCAWCLQPDFGDKPRCFQSARKSCHKNYIWNPKNEQEILANKILHQSNSSSSGSITQISPQRVELKLRISK